MATKAAKRSTEPEPRPIIVKKIIADGHGGHHGGAWKVAYADFVTAMMAFFLLMWLLGATTEKQRKGLADYFTPTLVQMKQDSAGSTGLFGGDSLISKENYPTTGGQGNMAITIPRDATGVKDVGGEHLKNADRQKFEALKRAIEEKMDRDAGLRRLKKSIRFTETREGLRIDLIDQADFAMFGMGTDRLLPEARTLLGQVAQAISGTPNEVIVRGHTDSLPYASGRSMNNWMLSTSRAEATRAVLAESGITGGRFARIEGVADREPFITEDRYDPRNRRMSVILAWSKETERAANALAGQGAGSGANAAQTAPAQEDGRTGMRKAARDDPAAKLIKEARSLDLGRTGLPAGATLVNPGDVPEIRRGLPPGKSEATAARPKELPMD